MKIAIIGCTHAGTAAAMEAAKLYKDADITVYEKNDNISFLSCGIALNVGGVVKSTEGLFYSSPEQLKTLGIKTCMLHEVLNIDEEKRILKVKDLTTNKEFEDSYDKLIMTTGSWPIVPKLKNIDLKNIVLCKNYNHAKDIIEKAQSANDIIVTGAGYIGVELVEAFRNNGKNVTLIDMEDRILSKYLDEEFTNKAEEALRNKGIKLALGESVESFEGKDGMVSKVITNNGEYKADLVILCIGFVPNTSLLQGKVNMLRNGAIIVDEYMRTSDKNIFAAGDSCAVMYNPTSEHAYIPLATNAVRMGTLAAHNLLKDDLKYLGTQGTSGIKIYNLNIASTGLTENSARVKEIDIKTTTITENNKPEFMEGYLPVTIKAVYHSKSHKILGAQLISEEDITPVINTISIAIQNGMTMEELAFVDCFFQPQFNKPWNLINTLGLSIIK